MMGEIKVKFPERNKVITLPRIKFDRGDFVWVKGDSGVGKSTLFLLMKGIIPKYIHADIEGDVPLFEDAAYLFQSPTSQIVSPFVLEELAFSMENMGLDVQVMKQRIDTTRQMLGVDFPLSHDTSCLSGGECQLLVLTSMLAAEPQVLLLDEPTAFLDTHARERFYAVLDKIKGKHTILLIDHNYKADLHDRTHDIESINNEQKNWIASSLPPGKINSIEPKISVHNLVFRHLKQTKLIEGFSMHVKGGEIVAVIGRNGAGKTTLLQLIAGILKPQSGDLKVQGKVSIVFQNPETHFYFDTVKEELPSDSDELARHFGLDEAMNQSPFSLSEGEKRRLTILMAVLDNRSIILYDEPTFGQDSGNIEKICQVMLSLKQQGRAQIIVTHDHELAARICDRIYYLN